MKKNNLQSGFSLIELIIYVALFSVIMGGLLVSVFQITDSTRHNAGKVTAEEELNFISKKIEFALSDMNSINSPTSGTSGTLNVDKTGYLNNPVIIKLETDGRIYYCEGTCGNSGHYSLLSSLNTKVDALVFEFIPESPTNKKGIRATLTLGGQTNIITKYFQN